MLGDTKERWLDTCAEVAICDDPKRLAELSAQILSILREEILRLEAQKPKTPTAA